MTYLKNQVCECGHRLTTHDEDFGWCNKGNDDCPCAMFIPRYAQSSKLGIIRREIGELPMPEGNGLLLLP